MPLCNNSASLEIWEARSNAQGALEACPGQDPELAAAAALPWVLDESGECGVPSAVGGALPPSLRCSLRAGALGVCSKPLDQEKGTCCHFL